MIFESKANQKRLIKKVRDSFSDNDVANLKKLFQHLKIMPKKKVKHSLRVATDVADVIDDRDVIFGALFHDYIERGGKVDRLPISNKAKTLVKLLTTIDDDYKDSKNIPLSHMKDVISQVEDEELKNKLILIKLADRLDKFKNKRISKKYKNKSKELIKFLLKKYTGENKSAKKLKKQFYL